MTSPMTNRCVSRSSGNYSRKSLAGVLVQRDDTGNILHRKKVYPNKDIVVGRDRSKCSYIINAPAISKKHLRIYSVVYDDSEHSQSEVDTLVFAEDLSSNGTYWNGSLIGRGNGGVLLSHDDRLKLAPNVYLQFQLSEPAAEVVRFDSVQEMEMAEFRRSYVLTDRLLGEGAYGRVFMAVEQGTRHQLACKVVDLRKLRPNRAIGRPERPAAAGDVDTRVQTRKLKDWIPQQRNDNRLEEKLKTYAREVEILNTISHPNIIGIEKVFATDNTLYLFQDLVTAGDLFSYIQSKNGGLLEAEIAVIVRQILVALAYLHSNNIVHRDLKPDNILMTSSSAGARVILTDFGAARRIAHGRQRMSSLVGTEEYAAPEQLCDAPASKPITLAVGYTLAVDMWALGCVTVVLLTGGSAFLNPTTGIYSEQLARSCDLSLLKNSPQWQSIRSRPKTFVARLLVLDEGGRMTAAEALNHEWFSNEVHKTNFEELYHRTIKHWRPRPSSQDTVEFSNDTIVKHMLPAGPLFRERVSRINNENAVEAHYRPAPKKVNQTLWPRRKAGSPFASEEVREAIRNEWPSKKDSTSVFGDDYDYGGEEQRLYKQRKRRELLQPIPTSKFCVSSRARRATSAPPKLVSSNYFQGQPSLFEAIQQPISEISPTGAPERALPNCSLALSEKNSSGKPVMNSKLVMGRPVSAILVTSVRNGIIEHREPGLKKTIHHARASRLGFETGSVPSQSHTEAQSDEQGAEMKQSIDIAQERKREEQSKEGPGKQERVHQKTAPVRPLPEPNTALVPKLKRWTCSPLQSPNLARTPLKRRRNSIFDIEEGDNLENSPSAGRRSKKLKKVAFVDDPMGNSDEGGGDGSIAGEITLPHRPVRLGVEAIGDTDELHLPR